MASSSPRQARPTPRLIWRSPPSPHSDAPVSVAVDRAECTIAWWAGWESGPLVHFVDAATGIPLGSEPCAALQLVPAGNGFITVDHGWRRRRRASPQLVAFDRRDQRDDPISVTRQPLPGGGSLVGAAPEGDRLLAFHSGRSELRRWPELDLLDAWHWYVPGVDWEAGCVWGVDGHELQLSALDRSWARSIPYLHSWWVHRAGDGVLRTGYHGIRLLRPRGPLLTVVPPTSRVLWHVSVTGGGRVVRAVLGDKPRRFLVDLDAARVVDAPRDAQTLARAPNRFLPTGPVWHPDPAVDAVALTRRWPRAAVWAAGHFLCRLPDGSSPHAWLAGGTSLLTSRRDGTTALLELWRLSLPS
jgi:hypothetical protein